MQYLLRKKISLLAFFVLCFSMVKAQYGEVYRAESEYKNTWIGISFNAMQNHFNYQLDKSFSPIDTPASNKGINNIVYNATPYFGIGIYTRTRIVKKLLLRTGLNMMVGDKKILNYTKFLDSTKTRYDLTTGSALINVPITLVLESDRYDALGHRDFMRHYVFAGAKLDYDFSIANGGAVKITKYGSNDPKVYNNVFNTADLGYEVGMGLSFYLKYATVSPEIKFSSSLIDIRNTNSNVDILNSIKRLQTGMVYFTINIEN